ncbi:MAG TPA: PmoA family protein [Pirellulales bacterium]|jgi:hypothetical protein
MQLNRVAAGLNRWVFFAAMLCVLGAVSWATAAEFTIEKTDHGAIVKIDGKLFTEYLDKSGTKPAMWPIIGPTGKPMTRPWPMDKSIVDAAKKEDITAGSGAKAMGKPLTNDHPHHRSLFFGHQSVNGTNEWLEVGNNVGMQKQTSFKDSCDGKTATIMTTNDWLDKDGKKLLDDERKITCRTDGDNRIIDYDVVLHASAGDVTLGDEKDALFALRVPDSMRVEAGKGGTFINSVGQVNEAQAWGKAADWIDYHGPVDGETLGIAILNHPDSYGYPTHWHTRDYGLFAANPFGLKAFANNAPGVDGTHIIKAGDSLKFRYRVIFHKGDEKEGRIAESFAKYAKEP